MRLTGILAALLAAWPLPAAAVKVDVYALVGGRIVTEAGPAIENGTIVLRDGVIEAVGAKIPVPPDARVIDAKGLTLTPGLVDAFGSLGLPVVRPPAAAAGGAPAPGAAAPGAAAPPTPPINPLQPHAMALERVRVADALRARDQGITTALVIGREGVLPGRSALINLNGARPDQMALRQPAALHLHMSTAGRGYPVSLMGTMAYARQQLLDARTYHESWVLFERAPLGRKRPRYSPELAALQDVLDGKLPLMVTAMRENDIRRALALGDELHIKVAIAGAARAFRLAPLLKERHLPVIVSVNFDPARPVTGGGDEDRERLDIDEAQRNPAALHKAGVPFALGSGFGPALLTGVRRAIDAGLPREAALRALTVEGARALGVADRIGSLERGKLANVVAWAGDPLDRRAKVKMVFVDGQLYEPPERPERPRGENDGDGPRPDEEPAPAPVEEDAP